MAMCAIPDGFPLPYDLVLYTFAEFEEDKHTKTGSISHKNLPWATRDVKACG